MGEYVGYLLAVCYHLGKSRNHEHFVSEEMTFCEHMFKVSHKFMGQSCSQ